MNTPMRDLTEPADPQSAPERWGSDPHSLGPCSDIIAAHERDHRRLHSYIEMTPTCWLWKGTFYTQFGAPTYGQFWIDGRRAGAHRASYIIHVGPVPDGLDILHSCDVKACVNPTHLRPGTHTENIREAFAKLPADHFAGERNGHARLTWDDIHRIRTFRGVFGSTLALAHEYGVSPTHITAIKSGRKWPESKCPVHAAPAEVAA